jgi:DNA-binding response OmpR family regulator
VENNLESTTKWRGFSEARVAGLRGAEAIFNHEKPDMELPDIRLPGKSGIELLKYTRRAGRFCWILMITYQADEYNRRLYLNRRRLFFDRAINCGYT